MKRSLFTAIGGWQPFLFCVGMYMVALFFSIFVCSSIFYAFNARSAARIAEKAALVSNTGPQLASVK
jgi:hypothetical protein